MNEYRAFGPPGTGKTTWLTGQVSRAVEARGADAVLVASFTKAAAVELAGRNMPVSPKNLGTLHALCYRELGSPTIAETKIAEFNRWQSTYTLSTGSTIDIDEPEQVFDSESDRIFAKYQTMRAQMIPPEKWPVQITGFAKNWEAWKRAFNYIDFTDMIELTLKFQAPPPNGVSIGFFDEVQDFTLLELSLVRHWAQFMDMAVLAGDDDQCIYGFKGATPDAFLNPEIPEERIRLLRQSWRMPRLVHDYSQRWIKAINHRQDKPFNPREADGALWHRAELTYRMPSLVVDELAAVTDAGQTAMVIAACSYQIAPIVNELRARGELFHNPYRRKRGDWNPLQQSRANTTSTKDRLLAMSIPHRELWKDDAYPWTWADVRKFAGLFRKTGVIQRGQSKALDTAPGDVVAPMADLMTIFEDAALAAIMRLDMTWISAHAASEKAKALEYPTQIVHKKGWAALLKTPKIIVGTIHSVKGGEADTVYLLPDLSRAGMSEYCDDRTRDNVTRQFYVGMTRAKENLILCGQSSPNSIRWI